MVAILLYMQYSKTSFFKPWKLEEHRLFELYIKSQPNSFTIALV